MGHQPKLGSYDKNRIFGQKKTKFLANKKHPLLKPGHHVPEKVVQRKSTLFQNKYQSLSKFWVFFWRGKTHFWTKKTLFGQT